MEEFLSPRKSRRERGFTLIETMVSIVVLTVGLISVAALMSSSCSSTSRSHYATTAAMLGSEKLEDLNRFPSDDPNLAPGGSLTADVAGYFDNVQMSSDNGAISETTSAAGVSTVYTQQPGGNITVTQNAGLPAPKPDSLTFNRRWVVAKDTPVAGVRQITVLVTLTNQTLKPAITYQVSVVHP